MTTIYVQRSVSEHLFLMKLRSNSHVLLTKCLDLSVNVHVLLQIVSILFTASSSALRTHKLFSKWDLLDLHLVHPSRRTAQHCAGGKKSSVLHDYFKL